MVGQVGQKAENNEDVQQQQQTSMNRPSPPELWYYLKLKWKWCSGNKMKII
jgi:hypothetical protein